MSRVGSCFARQNARVSNLVQYLLRSTNNHTPSPFMAKYLCLVSSYTPYMSILRSRDVLIWACIPERQALRDTCMRPYKENT